MSFAKDTTTDGGTASKDTTTGGGTPTKDETTGGLHAWGGDNLTHGNPGLFDQLGVGGSPGQSIEAGGIAHFQATEKVTVTH